MSDSEHVVILITVGSFGEADKIAQALVERMLAACVNIIPSITSVYRWQDEVQRDSEVLLMAKSRRDVFEHLASCVQELHSYETPEIIALPIAAGDADYLRWLDRSVPGGWHAVD
ncbi:MAG: divalent-cation tolerance protein CutA [Chloroflexi bacterium]|nr:divalent-cation tolerance protein CutA [Chloroflexota bacterium]